MEKLILTASFDGNRTVWAPLSGFSGGGTGAPAVESWFLRSDGRGKNPEPLADALPAER